jgi:hypothetical protein
VAADTAFLTNDIRQAGAGHGVDPRDTAAFAAILRGIIDDDAETRAMSIAAFDQTGSIGLTPVAWTDRLMETYNIMG